jgi:hypothetical protein
MADDNAFQIQAHGLTSDLKTAGCPGPAQTLHDATAGSLTRDLPVMIPVVIDIDPGRAGDDGAGLFVAPPGL